MPIPATPYIWFNGKLVPWEKATVHVLSHALHYGSSVFEGVRAYATNQGVAIFRLADHTRRLFDSAKIYRIQIPFTQEQISAAQREVVAVNGLKNGAYLRPLAKAAGNYLSSQLISMEAKRLGFAEGIGLAPDGTVSEGAGENLFLIRDGIIHTPGLAHSALGGITRDSVMRLARDMGYEVRETSLPRELLYLADELFFTGTAAEVTPIRSVDRIVVGEGKRGPITEKLQKAFFGLFTGATVDKYGWLDKVDMTATPRAANA
jgi:branched-chain amino acid aminotransferase